ncbi:MAG: hypothetical protein IT289_07510 [Oligoflexia bacterium]|nr:hypothetical protein [Oligoflexia bacterium]
MEFWVTLIQAMAWRESSHNPQVKHLESQIPPEIDDGISVPIVSRGLLQVSYYSLQNETLKKLGCPIKKYKISEIPDQETRESQVHDVELNLRCGVALMTKYISRDNVISQYQFRNGRKRYYGLSSYWAVLREGDHLNYIVDQVRKSPSCRPNESIMAMSF